MKYEGVDNNKEIVYYFKDLSIDTTNHCTLRSESFYTNFEQFNNSIGQLYNSESLTVINTFTNNGFKYQIMLSDEIILPTILISSIFNLSNNSWYNNIKFMRLFIDSKPST